MNFLAHLWPACHRIVIPHRLNDDPVTAMTSAIISMSPAIYAIVGADNFQQLEALAEITAAAGPSTQRIDFDGETDELVDILDEVRSYAMFTPSKLVVVRNADDLISRFREPLESALETLVPTGTLVLRLKSLNKTWRVSKQLAKVGKIITTEPPPNLPAWCVARAKSHHKLTLPLDAARELADRIGDDMGKLDQELAKLSLLTPGTATAAAIAGSVTYQRDQEMYALTNALARGDTRQAVIRFRQLLATDPATEFKATTWLGLWLADVDFALRQPSAARAKLSWKFKGPALDEFFATAKALGHSGVRAALTALADADRRGKSGLGDLDALIERFIITVGQKR
jgi:DNA polymerase III delta subunit